MRPTRLAAGMLLTLSILPTPASGRDVPYPSPPVPGFTQVVGFATKTGYRGVFAWQATQPVAGIVRFGPCGGSLDATAAPLPGAPDTAQLAVADGLQVGTAYCFQVVDQLTGIQSGIASFFATNAYTDHNGSVYTIDLLWTLDTEGLPPELPADQALDDLAAGVNVAAERVFDALDGWARLGSVLITDTEVDNAANVPMVALDECAGVANRMDVLVQTSAPFDAHTYLDWGIDRPCRAIFLGRLGQPVMPWADDLHIGYTAAHELMHYAFNAVDLYDLTQPEAGCSNLDWDGSLMHNTGGWDHGAGRWFKTELDRNPALTPCDMLGQPYSWARLRERYGWVPEAPDGPVDRIVDTLARGNPDGGALDIWILDRSPGGSQLRRFTANDSF